MNLCEAKQKEYSQALGSVENMNSTIDLLEEEITSNISKSNKLKIEEIRLKHEFAIFNDSINEMNGKLYD